jgi:predicted Zn-dependent protease
MKVIIAAALCAAIATPCWAQSPNLTDAVTVLSAIQKDETKRKTYCDMQDLLAKAEEAQNKKDEAQAKSLAEQAEVKTKSLGDDFQKLTAIDADIDPSSEEGKKYFEAWEALEKSCAKT